MAAVDDADLVARARQGDQDAFTVLLRRYDQRLRGLAYKLLGDRDRMDDVLQEAYLSAYRALPRFRGEASVSSWLYRITYNACLDELRRARVRPVPAEHTADQASRRPGPERVVTAADTAARALAALPPDQRATVLLVDGEGFDNVTAAEILGVAPGTIASRLSRARNALRAALGERAGEPGPERPHRAGEEVAE